MPQGHSFVAMTEKVKRKKWGSSFPKNLHPAVNRGAPLIIYGEKEDFSWSILTYAPASQFRNTDLHVHLEKIIQGEKTNKQASW